MIVARTAFLWLALAPAPSEPVAPAQSTPSTAPTTPPSTAPGSTAPTPTAPDEVAPTPAGEVLAIDTVLPCGLRLVAAQDKTLPVAAIVLAVETGTEDDPADQPGLVHALAYQLLQGNRELSPHGVAQLVHDGGGVTALAIGPAQIRYESLVPVSMIDDVLWAEAQRLRAPTVSAPLWKDTLRWARRDPGRNWIVPVDALAAVHQVDGLGHDGHHTPAELDALSARAVSTALAERFTVERATLVVVAPMSPDLVLNRVLPLFSDLPAVERRARDRTTAVRSGASPRELKVRGGRGVLAWPVAGDGDGLAAAQTLCGALARQRRHADESARAKIKCTIDEDPRRGIVVLDARGTDDPVAFVRHRLERLRGTDASLLETQRTQTREELAMLTRTPLALARRLATVEPVGRKNDAPPMRPLAELTGAAILTAPLDPLPPELAALLDVGAAVRLVEPAKSGGAK